MFCHGHVWLPYMPMAEHCVIFDRLLNCSYWNKLIFLLFVCIKVFWSPLRGFLHQHLCEPHNDSSSAQAINTHKWFQKNKHDDKKAVMCNKATSARPSGPTVIQKCSAELWSYCFWAYVMTYNNQSLAFFYAKGIARTRMDWSRLLQTLKVSVRRRGTQMRCIKWFVLNSQCAYVGITNYVFSPDFGGFLLKTQYFNYILLMTLWTFLKNIQ